MDSFQEPTTPYMNTNMEQQELKQRQLHFFKKNSSHTAKAIIFVFLLSYAATFVLLYGTILIALSPDLPEIIGYIQDYPFDQAARMIQIKIAMDHSWIIDWQYLLIAAATLIGNAVPAILCAKKTGVKVKKLFRKGQTTFTMLVTGIIFTFGASMLGSLIYSGLNVLLEQVGLVAEPSALDMPYWSVPGLTGYIIAVCVVAPLTEELLFRGAILKTLSRYGTVFAAVISSLIFGLMHGNFQQMPFAFMIGMVYSYFTIKTGSIRLSILLHFINNAYSTIGTMLASFYPETHIINIGFSLLTGLLFFGSMVAAIVILVKKRRSIYFVCDDPELASGDNAIQISNPGARYFARPAVIVMTVLLLGLMATSLTGLV